MHIVLTVIGFILAIAWIIGSAKQKREEFDKSGLPIALEIAKYQGWVSPHRLMTQANMTKHDAQMLLFYACNKGLLFQAVNGRYYLPEYRAREDTVAVEQEPTTQPSAPETLAQLTISKTGGNSPAAPAEEDRAHNLPLFVREAISTLRYFSTEAEEPILHALLADPFGDARSVARGLRKAGTPLTKVELKALGIRANAYATHEFLALLAERGRSDPIRAGDQTLMRAMLNYDRDRSRRDAVRAGFHRFKALAGEEAMKTCAGCRAVNAEEFQSDDIPLYNCQGCEREACVVIFQPIISQVE